MKRSTKYVGLDVYEATTVACVREESGRVIARAVVPTEEEALLELFGTMRGSVHVAFEEGTQAQWLDDLLTPRLHRVLLCDRRGERKQGNKGDLLDADQISAAASAAASRPGVARVLPRHGRARHEGGTGPGDAGQKAGCTHAPHLEDRRNVRPEQVEHAGRITPGATDGWSPRLRGQLREIRRHTGARERLLLSVRPATVCRGTRLTPDPLAGPEEASGRRC
jgi:hypothetical protein